MADVAMAHIVMAAARRALADVAPQAGVKVSWPTAIGVKVSWPTADVAPQAATRSSRPSKGVAFALAAQGRSPLV